MRLRDRVVLVTGSGSGIGFQTAVQVLAEGGRVMVHDLDHETAARAVESLGESDRVGMVSGDLAEIATPTRLVEATLDRFGKIDGLVNNASVSARTSLENTKPEDFDRIFAINLRAPLFLIQAAWPSFRAQGYGYVVNIGSVCAYCGGEHLIDYSMSKGGLLTLTRNLSASHAKHGLRINLVNPGWTVTPNEIVRVTQIDGSPENFEEMIPKHVMPFGRLLRPTDLAPFICMLLSEEGSMLSGNVYDFNPGTVHGRL